MSSYGQSILKEILERNVKGTFHENYRPEWMFGLELDFYYPQHKLAFEFQGDQHLHTPIYGEQALIRQKKNDKIKRMVVRAHGITIIQIQACDLYHGAVRKKISQRGFPKVLVKCKQIACPKGKEYRKLLKEKYNAPSAYKKGSKMRKKLKTEAISKLSNSYHNHFIGDKLFIKAQKTKENNQ
jgi:hypothetical protein